MEGGITEEETPEETTESKDEDEEEHKGEDVTELSEYQVLEKTYQNVHAQMEQTEGMETFAHEYSRVFEAYFKSCVRQEELVNENESLKTKVEDLTAKLHVAEEFTATDKEKIDQLKLEIEQAWKTVDSAHAREENSQELIENQRQQINRLNSEMEQRARLGLDQGEESGSAKKDKDNFLRERERLMHEVVILRERLSNALSMQLDLEKKNSATDLRCNELTQELENQTNEVNKELRVKERMEQELHGLTINLENKDTELSALKLQLSQGQRNASKLETNVKELKVLNERLQKDSENLNSRLTKMQVDLEFQIETLEKVANENASKTHELKIQGEEVARLRNEANKVGKMREHFVKKLTQAENQRGDLEQEKEKLKGIIGQLEKDLDVAKRQAESDKKACESLQREREILNRNILKAAAAAYEQQKLMKLQNQVKKNLEVEIDNFNFEASKQKKAVSNLEKERDRYVLETQELAQKVQDTLDEVKLKQVAIFDYKKKIAEADTKFRMQQNLFEAVRSDRNTFSKLLLEAQDEISELKQKLKVMSHQIEQLKEDITTKETQLMKEENALQKSEKEKENIKVELRKMKNELQESKAQIAALNLEERKLNKIIQDSDEERERLRKEMEQIMNERDILGTQLVRRNDELSLLYEKIKILQSTLEKGEAQYDQRLEDIRLLKLEIKRLRQEKNLLSRSVVNMTDMRQEIFHLERDLTREKLKCRALEEELQSPLNIHRWRKLEGSDPTTFELIQKIQLLQKRLLSQAQTAIKQDAQLQESERLYLNLRQLLARQPGPEVTIQLQETQRALRNRGRKMKCLVSELSMYEMQVSEYKFDLERINDELKNVKKKYFLQKQQEQKMKERERDVANNFTMPAINNGSKTRFMGGGFNLSAVPTKFIEKS